jgi:adenine/guanine phosphoribosyltransferase-like PRPP-binding protein
MIIILVIIFIIHYCLINGLEKIIINLYKNKNKKTILRPIAKCFKQKNYITYCIGMPSGHAEITTIISYILYNLNYISYTNMCIIIVLMCLQRIISKKHTPLQTIIGVIFGLFYANIYLKYKISYKSIIIASIIVFLYINIIIYKLTKLLNVKIPNWVDKKMLKNIEDKKNINYNFKFTTVFISPIVQNTYFYLTWNDLEYYLEMLLKKINKTNIKYDAVVGIKTGGAIISDYISKKLNIKNYKIKINDIKYNCNKNKLNYSPFSDFYNKYSKGEKKEYEICEKIDDDLENKNIILIDETVGSGVTMKTGIQYLLSKKVKTITPTCIVQINRTLFNNYNLISIIKNPKTFLVWPWGYDN